MKQIITGLLAISILAACSKEEPQKKESIVKGFGLC